MPTHVYGRERADFRIVILMPPSRARGTARTSPRCTGSDGRTSLTLPLANTGKFVAGLETFWRRKKEPQLTAEIPGGNWRGVRDSNPEVHPGSRPVLSDLPSGEQFLIRDIRV